MEDTQPLVLVGFILTLIIFAIGAIYYPVLYILHRLLSSRLDPILFKAPYFNRAEQINYRFFPLYLVKAINYIYLVAWPTMAKKRRFKGLETPLPIGKGLRATCIIQFSLMIIGTLAGIAWFSLPLITFL
ncbi:hypothetical protein [Marinimicrobium locisalis]|uniref:hypothetical protein n=1 Tax=Marinimicrobium locisalis TaxID=546022 RepID=UPI0032213E09